MYEDKIVLCGANSYEEKYYLNPDFDNLPDHIKDELKIMCVLYVHDVGGILTLVYEEDGSLCFEVTSEEGDPMFDEIGSALKIKELQRTKEELLQSLQLYYRVFFMGEELDVYKRQVVSRVRGGCVVSIKDGRYNIDTDLAKAISI